MEHGRRLQTAAELKQFCLAKKKNESYCFSKRMSIAHYTAMQGGVILPFSASPIPKNRQIWPRTRRTQGKVLISKNSQGPQNICTFLPITLKNNRQKENSRKKNNNKNVGPQNEQIGFQTWSKVNKLFILSVNFQLLININLNLGAGFKKFVKIVLPILG